MAVLVDIYSVIATKCVIFKITMTDRFYFLLGHILYVTAGYSEWKLEQNNGRWKYYHFDTKIFFYPLYFCMEVDKFRSVALAFEIIAAIYRFYYHSKWKYGFGWIFVPRRANTRTGDIVFVSVCPSRIRVVLCARDSAQTASQICTYVVLINFTIIVDVQHTFHFDLISDPGQGHKNFVFSACFIYHRLYLCLWRSPNRFTYLHIFVPINCTIIVDVQHTCHFYLDHIADPCQGCK